MATKGEANSTAGLHQRIGEAFLAAEVARADYEAALQAVVEGRLGDASDLRQAFETAKAAAMALAADEVAAIRAARESEPAEEPAPASRPKYPTARKPH